MIRGVSGRVYTGPMCASYGLGGGRITDEHVFGIDPMDTREGRAMIDRWMAERGGKAAITGARAKNLNPVIMADTSGTRVLQLGWWWLWLDGSGPVKFSAFNSRDDKLLRSWRGPFQHRALLPATWYVEKGERFALPGDDTFGIAALTSTVTDNLTGERRVTYSMVTRNAVGEAADTWHRMPLVLPGDMHDEWLDPERAGTESLVGDVLHASDEISAAMRKTDSDSVTLF